MNECNHQKGFCRLNEEEGGKKCVHKNGFWNHVAGCIFTPQPESEGVEETEDEKALLKKWQKIAKKGNNMVYAISTVEADHLLQAQAKQIRREANQIIDTNIRFLLGDALNDLVAISAKRKPGQVTHQIAYIEALVQEAQAKILNSPASPITNQS